MRVLNNSDRNELILVDTISDSGHPEIRHLYYRMPTTTERVEFAAKSYKKIGDKLIAVPEIRIEYAEKILTGIGENEFGDDNGKAISSDQSKGNYHPEWKRLVKEYASDLLLVLTNRIYENLYIQEAVKNLPLQQNSGSESSNAIQIAKANA